MQTLYGKCVTVRQHEFARLEMTNIVVSTLGTAQTLYQVIVSTASDVYCMQLIST